MGDVGYWLIYHHSIVGSCSCTSLVPKHGNQELQNIRLFIMTEYTEFIYESELRDFGMD